MPTPRIRVRHIELRVLPMRTRFPFRYGIASLHEVPHVFVSSDVEIDGKIQRGLSSEGLPPKWFTKNPDTTTAQDLYEMISVVQQAAVTAERGHAGSYFELWQMLQLEMKQWGAEQGFPPLLWHLGVSLIERTVLDALCKSMGQPLHKLLKSDALGVEWPLLQPEANGRDATHFLPAVPLDNAYIRHTVGLGDPIRRKDIPPDELMDDGLPQALEDVIPLYGVSYFKIKLSGDVPKDVSRLSSITEVIRSHCGNDFSVTLDGNENFHDIVGFRDAFEQIQREPMLSSLLQHLLWVEQPLHRSHALLDSVGMELQNWPDAPALIIDESDGPSGAAVQALRLGYSGVSHKNCKGILKGLANAALIHECRERYPGRTFVLSGEDLCTAGPVALNQDLAMMSLLGVQHIERNGHHYFRGLSMYPNHLDEAVAKAHPDLYQPNSHGLIALKISVGRISLKSINDAPFGCGLTMELSGYDRLEDWMKAGGVEALGR